ncbi:unnamed protein product [Rhodiola kirilowii]
MFSSKLGRAEAEGPFYSECDPLTARHRSLTHKVASASLNSSSHPICRLYSTSARILKSISLRDHAWFWFDPVITSSSGLNERRVKAFDFCVVMGGHGGLNILPQKRWNVYRFDNMEKVRLDEEAAAKEEQLKREQTRKRDAEFRMEKLRTAKGLEPLAKETVKESQSEAAPPATEAAVAVAVEEPQSDSNHINLFEGIRIFDIVEKEKKVEKEDERARKKRRKEEPVRVVTAEDEKFRLGYGVAGKGVKLPWYMSKPSDTDHDQDCRRHEKSDKRKDKRKSSGKKSLEELREERLAREKREKARERALLVQKGGRDRPVPEDRYHRR